MTDFLEGGVIYLFFRDLDGDIVNSGLIDSQFDHLLVGDCLVDLEVVGVELHSQEVLVRIVDLRHQRCQGVFLLLPSLALFRLALLGLCLASTGEEGISKGEAQGEEELLGGA